MIEKEHRPWGWFESLKLDKCFQVKRIFVKPGAAISLQSHKFRSEHWIVVAGTAKTTIGSDIKIIAEGQSVYIPLSELFVHLLISIRCEGPGLMLFPVEIVACFHQQISPLTVHSFRRDATIFLFSFVPCSTMLF